MGKNNSPDLEVDEAGNVKEKTRPEKGLGTAGKIYFDIKQGNYWLQIPGNRYLQLGSASIKRQLQMAGMDVDFCGKHGLKNWERALAVAEIQNYVDYAGALAGYDAGFFITEGGKRILVTEGFRFPQAKKDVACEWLEKFCASLLGPDQFRYFALWLKFARESLAKKSFRPGQFLILCGPPQCGKSLLQNIVTLALGGRVADPWLYMTDRTPFNADLCQAEHLAIEDKGGSFDIRARLKLASSIKDIAAVANTSLHGKGRQAITLRVYKRGTQSLNNEPENLMQLPPMDDHLRDKVMLFDCSRAEVEDDKLKVWQRIVKELPGFLWQCDMQPCPKGLADSRYGVKYYAAPALVEALESHSPQLRLDSLITEIVFDSEPTLNEWEGTADNLEKRLMGSSLCFAVQKVFTFTTACGVYLARLRQRLPNRYASRKVQGKTLWTIKKRPVEELF